MKNSGLSFLAFILIATVLNGCKLIDKLTQFDINYSTAFSVPPTGLLGINVPIVLPESEVTTNSESAFSNNNTAADHVKEIHLKTVKLTITSPADQKFDFLKNAQIFISASGLPKIQVASIDNIDPSTVGNSIDLVCSGQDLKEYLKKPTFTISETVTTSKETSSTINIRADVTFFVQGSILKQ
jgi:hypothetical protein